MSRSAISQTGYPRQILYNGDHVVAITLHQMAMLNIAHSTWAECQEIQDSLLDRIDSAIVADSLYNRDIQGYKQLLETMSTRIQQRNELISTQAADIRGKDRQIRKLRTHKTLFGISSAVLAGIVLVLLL